MRRILFVLPLLVALSACIKTSAVELAAPRQYPPVDPNQVQVFLKEEDVKAPFDKLALIDARGNYSYADDERLVKAMKKKAGELGANAIILGEFKEPSTFGKIADHVVGVGGDKKAQVLAIRIKS